MTRQYALHGKAGLVQQHKAHQTGTIISIYNSKQAGYDVNEGKWALVCEDHSTITQVDKIAIARHFAPSPLTWCEVCNGNDKPLEDE